mmetsp:Transcript_46878/g.106308  ORF Transcript_46878/g.106308 Transcript_46878/m.106308 type:complete len:254 (+) Transcript_46878:829-1590(+)
MAPPAGEPGADPALCFNCLHCCCRLDTWALSCLISTARPFQDEATGSSTTAKAFSMCSSVPNSFSRTFFCRWANTFRDWNSWRSSCSLLEAVRYFFRKSSIPNSWATFKGTSWAGLPAPPSESFFTSVCSWRILLFWVSRVVVCRLFFFVSSRSFCLTSLSIPPTDMSCRRRSISSWARWSSNSFCPSLSSNASHFACQSALLNGCRIARAWRMTSSSEDASSSATSKLTPAPWPLRSFRLRSNASISSRFGT